MNVTLYSFAMAVFLSTVFVLLTHLFRRKEFFLRCFGVPTMLFLYGACAFRMVLPLEFPFTRPVGIPREQGDILQLILQEDALPIGNGASVLELMLCIWLAGTVCVSAVFLGKYFRSMQKVHVFAKVFPVSETAKSLLAQIQKESPRNLPMRICICPGLEVPMGVGIFRRWILLTGSAYTEDELYYILKHEYIHFCNRDLLVRMLVSLFCCVFWWNPAGYLLQKDVAEMLELKCDMACTEGFSKEQKIGYLSILTRLVEDAPEKPKRKKHPFFSKTGAALLQQKNNLSMRERFHLIRKPARKGKLLGQVLVLGMFAVLLAASYAVVVQPKYDPPMEEIYTDSSIYVLAQTEGYILKHKDGSFSRVTQDGSTFKMSKEIAEILISEGIPTMEE